MTNTNSKTIHDDAKALIRYVINFIDDCEGFEGTPDDWQKVLSALKDRGLIGGYFGDADIAQDQINHAIFSEAYYSAYQTLISIKDEKAVKAQMRAALRSKFEEFSKEELIEGRLISAEITIGLVTFLASINTRYCFDSDDTDEMIGSTIDDLINDFVEEMDEDNLVVNL